VLGSVYASSQAAYAANTYRPRFQVRGRTFLYLYLHRYLYMDFIYQNRLDGQVHLRQGEEPIKRLQRGYIEVKGSIAISLSISISIYGFHLSASP